MIYGGVNSALQPTLVWPHVVSQYTIETASQSNCLAEYQGHVTGFTTIIITKLLVTHSKLNLLFE